MIEKDQPDPWEDWLCELDKEQEKDYRQSKTCRICKCCLVLEIDDLSTIDGTRCHEVGHDFVSQGKNGLPIASKDMN